MNSLDLLVDVGGQLYVQDPDTGRLLNTMSGGQYEDYSYGSYDSSSYSPTDYSTPYQDDFSAWNLPQADPSMSGQYQWPAADSNVPLGPAATGTREFDVTQAGGQLNPDGTPQGGGSWFDRLFPNAGGAAAPGAGAGGGFGGMGTAGLLGLLGGGAGLIGALSSGGKTGSTTPIMSTPMRAAGNQSYDALQGLNRFAQGQSPMQQQQAALLNALAQGQATPGLQKLIQDAYGPAYQNVAKQSIDAGRTAGFFDNPMSSPVGGAIMGPAAAQLQGQQANSLLQAMFQIPGMFQDPINSQIGAQQNQATGFSNLMRGYPTGTQTSQPLGAQIGQGAAGTLMGMGQGMQNNANQVAQQAWQQRMYEQNQQSNNDFRTMMGRMQGGGQSGPTSQPYAGTPNNIQMPNTTLNTRPDFGYNSDTAVYPGYGA